MSWFGHSLAGLNARLFAKRHPGDLAGLVFVDPTSPEYLRRGKTWREYPNGASISYRTAYDSGRSVTFGDLRAIALHARRGRASTGAEARELANRTSNGRLVHSSTNHGIHRDEPELVVEAINLVVDSARSDDVLPPCRKTRLTRLGGECPQ
jgi:hypothetical protein